jgi:hypothetical protein
MNRSNCVHGEAHCITGVRESPFIFPIEGDIQMAKKKAAKKKKKAKR